MGQQFGRGFEGVFSIGVSTGGNTDGSTTVMPGQLVFAGGNNITLSQSTVPGRLATISIIGGAGGGGGGSFSAGVSTFGNTLGTTGTVSNQVIFVGGNNITLSQSSAAGGATITISALNTVAQTNQTLGIYGSSQTVGQSSSSTYDARSLTLVGDGIVSVGWSNSSLRISATTAAQTNQSLGIYASSNTTGQSSSSTYDARSLSIVGAGVASVGWSNSSLIISVPSGGGAGDGVNIIAAGTQTANTTGTVVFSNSNGISFGMSNSSVVTASYTVPTQTNQTAGIYGSSQTTGQSSSSTYDARSLSLVGAGAVSVGWSNSSLLVSAPNTIAQTNQSLGIYGSSQTTGQSSSSTYDARSLSLVGAGAVSVGWSNSSLIVSAPNTIAQTNQTAGLYASSQTVGQSSSSTYDARSLTIVGDGIVSVGWSNASFRISATTAAQTNQTLGIYASSNTTGQSSSSTHDARSLSIVGAGIASVGWSNSSLIISVPSGGGAGDGVNIIAAGTQTANTTGTVVFSNSNGISFGMSNSSVVTASYAPFSAGVSTGGNTTGNTGTVSNQFILAGGDHIILSQDTGAGGATATISWSKDVVSQWANFENIGWPAQGGTSQWIAQGANLPLMPIKIPHYLTCDIGVMVASNSIISTTSAPVTNSTTTTGSSASASGAWSINWYLFTRGTGGYNTNLYTYYTTQQSYYTSVSWSQTNSNTTTGSNTMGSTIGYSIGFVELSSGTQTSVNAGSTVTTWNTFMSTFTQSTTSSAGTFPSSTGISQYKRMIMPFATSMTPGQYWFAGQLTSTSSGAYNAIHAAPRYQNLSQVITSVGVLGGNTNSTVQFDLGAGRWSNTYATSASTYAQSGQSSGAINLSHITTSNAGGGTIVYPLLRFMKDPL